MAGVVVPTAKPKESALDLVMKGLAIAKDVYGIHVAGQQADEARQEKADVLAGVITPAQRLALGQNYNEVDADAPGAMQMFVKDEAGNNSPLYFATKQQSKDLAEIKTTNKDGTESTRFVPKEAGAEYTSYPKPEKKEKDRLIEIDTVDANGNPIKKVVTAQAGATYPRDEKPNDSQLQAAGFGKRAIASDSTITKLLSSGYDPSSSWKIKNKLPFVGNMVSSDDDQSFSQAKMDFVTAVLRKESGAAISPKEFEGEDLKYFPQIGDSQQVIAQKADSRQRAIETLKAQSGRSWEKVNTIVANKSGASGNWGEAIASPTAKTDAAIEKYAKEHGLDYQASRAIMVKRGYKPNE